mgnify:CR=1 FL=1
MVPRPAMAGVLTPEQLTLQELRGRLDNLEAAATTHKMELDSTVSKLQQFATQVKDQEEKVIIKINTQDGMLDQIARWAEVSESKRHQRCPRRTISHKQGTF